MTCPHCSASNADDARFCGSCGQTLSATESSSSLLPAVGEAPSLIGREIAGRYRVQAKLGEGGMGAVYKAEQISLKRQVAVKLLRPEVAGAQVLLQRFNAEAQVVAKLSHPNTVNIYDFGQDSDGALFIAMEFIEGQSLRTVIHHEAPLPLRRALSIGLQIAASLTDAHAHGIVHRDLKPDNVMLQDRGRQRDVVRVLDFGIAKLRDESRQSQFAMTQAGDILGTPQYMAPEQIRGETIDGRTDIYALGGLLYEMITGRLPFESATVMGLLSKHLIETIEPPSQRRPDLHLPPAIDALILGAMAKEPAQRPQSMEAFGEQLAALLATFPVDTAQATAQVDVPAAPPPERAAPPSIETPVAYSAAPAAPFVPHAPPPGAGVSPTMVVGASPAYSPFPPPSPPPPPSGAQDAQRHGGAGKGFWVVLALLVVAGLGTGLYAALNRGGNRPVVPAPGDAAPPPDAAKLGGDDPWASAPDPDRDRPSAPIGAMLDQDQNVPPECQTLIAVYESLMECKALPPESYPKMVKGHDWILQYIDQLHSQHTLDTRRKLVQECAETLSVMQELKTKLDCQ